jgi:hypothetical protein
MRVAQGGVDVICQHLPSLLLLAAFFLIRL